MGEAMVQKVGGGADLASVLTASGGKFTEAGLVTRRSPLVPPELLAAAFRAPKPGTKPGEKPVLRGVALSDGGYGVFDVRAVVVGEPEGIPQEQRDQRRSLLVQRVAMGEMEALVAQLRQSAEVVVAPKLFSGTDPGTDPGTP